MAGVTEKTLAAFKWRFRDTALWAAVNYSPAGGVDAVKRVLDELDLLDYPVGPGVSLRNTQDFATFPDGTVVSQGEPSDVPRYNVWAVHGGRQHHVLGTGRISNRPWLICEMPEHERPAWLDAEPAANEAALLASWKKVCWAKGYEAKVRHGWCGEFETVMFSMEVRP